MTAFTDLLHPEGKVLVVTNDFPPRVGGIQTFVRQLVGELPPDRVVVHASAHPDASAYDAEQSFAIVRDPSSMLLPTPAATRRVVATLREHGCSQVVYGAAAPLGLMARTLRSAGAHRQVAITHGHEVWWAALPGTRAALRRIAADVDVLTHVSEYTRGRIAPALPASTREKFIRLSPEVDRSRFHPGQDGSEVRRVLGIPADALVVASVGRLVRRKGQVDLVRVWPEVLRRYPGSHLVIVGEGPDRAKLERMVRRRVLGVSVHLLGEVPDVVPYLAAADVFASPSRARWWGLEVEAFGIVYAEAAAMGLALGGSMSGGTHEARCSQKR
ncbi:glycosyltransferase family 4 protein [Nocardioides marmoribigeumensis]|uniref:Phosphatidylinositol alpha-1,6-mannosyltransferase n=1 Tax=Nocardioides marmoribigeumensis TaxID=433649 RepID=A0ABU2BS50_9ACTN|nr:glycosyltransferase family 4 protein [Nocardioides marmoribigeumensis]MDR7360553.1 phosphatidylinositol alpha-1,6-mannosyltransferase [Nocardioides marmoribigeumensis]